MKLLKGLQASLSQIAAAQSKWSHDGQYDLQDAIKLEKLGLVKLRPRYTGLRARGQCRGRLDGYDVALTDAGKALL